MASFDTTTDEPPTGETPRDDENGDVNEASDSKTPEDETASTATPSPAKSSARNFPANRARFHVIVTVLAIVLAGYAITFLDRTDPKPVSGFVTSDQQGASVTIIANADALGALMNGQFRGEDLRLVMARRPIELRLRESSVLLLDGSKRTIPQDAQIVLVGDDGSIEPIWIESSTTFSAFVARVLSNWGARRGSDWLPFFALPENRVGLGEHSATVERFWLEK